MKPRAAQAFSAGESFTVAGVALARNSAVIEAGLDLQATRKTRVGLAYQGSAIGVGAGPWRAREPDRSFLGAAGPRRPGGASRPYTRGRRTDSAFQEILGIFLDLLQRLRQQGKSTHT